MVIHILRFLIAGFFISAPTFVATAQQDHFVYLQSENKQPFYVRINKNILSSSPAGYIIIPKLTDGTYEISIGFPRNEFPTKNFSLSIDANNKGFLLKNFGDKGWGLFNLQSYDVAMGSNSGSTPTVSKKLENDPFSNMLARVVKDSSLLQKKEIPASPQDSPKSDSSNVAVAAAVQTDTVSKVPDVKPPALLAAVRLLSKKNKDGIEMVYVDPNEAGGDTVRIFIPVQKKVLKKKDTTGERLTMNEKGYTNNTVTLDDKTPSSPIGRDTSSAITSTVKNHNQSTTASAPVFIEDISSIKKSDSTRQNLGHSDVANGDAVYSIDSDKNMDTATDSHSLVNREDSEIEKDTTKDNIVVLPKVVQSSKVNSDCKAFADNEDFLRLRKKMASANSDDNMIKAAKKAFHSKCFSTEQIRNLSQLFLTSAGKYKFFDEAYAFVSDSDQFYTLQSQFSDIYYLNRFKAMIRK
jgi:hypothetical protein